MEPDLAQESAPDLAPPAATPDLAPAEEGSPPYAAGHASRTAAGTAPQRATKLAPSPEDPSSEEQPSARQMSVRRAVSSTGLDLEALSREVSIASPFSSTNAPCYKPSDGQVFVPLIDKP